MPCFVHLLLDVVMFPIPYYNKHATKSPCPGVGRMNRSRQRLRGKVCAFLGLNILQTVMGYGMGSVLAGMAEKGWLQGQPDSKFIHFSIVPKNNPG